MLNRYKDKKNKILKQYTKVLELGNILPKDITVDDIKEKKRQLEEEHFFVSFTGQIKAGKSTLINALVFGEEIIPADDTPHTAKITIIKYGDSPKLEATFYNKEEWKTLESNQEFYEEFLKPDIEKSISKGLFTEEIINSTAKVKTENSLKNLAEYVARDGKYTPFVNLVTLYYPNEVLKEITIVDTPGTNDPNKLRDKVAKEWIHKTNANIYITYANQAMDKVDMDFIDNFLLAVPKEQKLTVINKIDSVNDSDGLEEYITELLADESLKRREIVSDREGLVLVSGLGALIDKMLIKELSLSEELEYYAEQLDEKGFLEPQNHKLPNLEKMIEQKLIENKGKNILESHSKFLNSIFEKRVLELEKKLELEKSKLSDLSKNSKELIETQKSLDNIILFIAKEQKSINSSFDELLKSKLDDFYSLTIEQNRKSVNSIKEELVKIKNSSNYKSDVLWIVKNSIDSNFDELRDKLRTISKEITEETQKNIDNLEYKLAKEDKNISINLTSKTFSVYTLELVTTMKKLAEKSFKKKKVHKIVKNNSEFFKLNILNRKKINSEIMDKIRSFFEKSSLKMKEEFRELLNKHIHKEILENIMKELTEIMDNKREEIENYINRRNDREDLIQKAQEERISLEKELELIKKYQEDMK